MRRFGLGILLLVIGAGCAAAVATPQPAATATLAVPTATAPPANPTASPAPSLTPTPSATPNPYEAYTIDFLRSRTYGAGQLEITDTLGDNGQFIRYLVQYPSDPSLNGEALLIHGFMDVPKGAGPFPVVIALHGYIDPAIYNTFDYTTHYADALANAGFLVIHPNLRGYKPSGDGDNLFRVGMADDVLNLIALLKSGGGQPGGLEKADPTRIGLWGHSMGGGIATRVITVTADVKAAVLYAPMSGDERKNYEAIFGWTNGERGQAELNAPEEALAGISPEFFFSAITAAVSLNQGTADQTVAVDWSRHTCALLQALGKKVECNYYDGAPHTFGGEADAQFMHNVVDFFKRYLLL